MQETTPIRRSLGGLAAVIATLLLTGSRLPAGVCGGDVLTITAGQVDAFRSDTDPQIFKKHWDAQTFLVPDSSSCFTFTSVLFSAIRIGSPGDLVVEIYNVDPATMKPVVPVGLGGLNSSIASTTVPAISISDTVYVDVVATFSSPVTVTGGVEYAVVFHQDGGNGANAYQVGVSNGSSDLYADGKYWRSAGSSWHAPGSIANRDVRISICLTLCGGPPPPPGSCTNAVDSVCCGLTQGAYGAPRSGSATSLGTDDCINPTGMGVLVAAACGGFNVFGGDPNQTTIGIHNTKSVTIGPASGGTFTGTQPSTAGTFPADLNTLVAYLPAGGTPGKFNSSVGSDTHYSAPGQIPDLNVAQGTSKGQGGGALSGQTMAAGFNIYLSANAFTPVGFGGFTLPGAGILLCTKRGSTCEAFSYPACVANKTVTDVRDLANHQLAAGSNSASCTASQLTQALDNINRQFDGCGQVIACIAFGGGTVNTPGVFTCP